jgi:hypothetical protein
MNIRCMIAFASGFLVAGAAMAAQPAEADLQKLALQYLGVHAQVLALKLSECAMGVTAPPKSYEEMLDSEVLPAFASAQRADRRRAFIALKPALLGGGESYIRKMLEETAKSGTLSRDFLCGYVTGLITSALQQTRKAWGDQAVSGVAR